VVVRCRPPNPHCSRTGHYGNQGYVPRFFDCSKAQKTVRKAFLPIRRGLCDHRALLRKDWRHAGLLPGSSECFMNQPSLPSNETHALKCALAGDVLRSYGSLRLQVTGWSMMPAVRPGDTLLVEAITCENVIEGDLVLFAREQRLFAHRVVKGLDYSGIITRGDAMPAEDPALHRSELLGKVRLIERNGRMIVPCRKLGLPESIVAALVRNSRVAARVIKGMHTRLRSRKPNLHNGCVARG